MSRFTIVTEGEQDVALLKALLNVPDNDANVTFIANRGWSSADTYARSLLIRGDTNVVLVVDADSTDPNLVEHRRRFLHGSLGEIASSCLWKVYVIEPEIEGLLFKDRAVVEALVGHPISDTDFIAATWEPKAILQRLMHGKSLTTVYDSRLGDLDLSGIRKVHPIPEILAFLNSEGPRRSTNRKKLAPSLNKAV